jgi:hypothetical protein
MARTETPSARLKGLASMDRIARMNGGLPMTITWRAQQGQFITTCRRMNATLVPLPWHAMVLRGGELDGARLLKPETVAQMRTNHLPGGGDLASMSQAMFSEADYAGVGFGLGFAMTLANQQYYWGGVFSTRVGCLGDRRHHHHVLVAARPMSSCSRSGWVGDGSHLDPHSRASHRSHRCRSAN